MVADCDNATVNGFIDHAELVSSLIRDLWINGDVVQSILLFGSMCFFTSSDFKDCAWAKRVG